MIHNIVYISRRIKQFINSFFASFGLSVINKSLKSKFKIYNKGKDNKLISGENNTIDCLFVKIIGNNNSIIIGKNVFIGSDCVFLIIGHNCQIVIGDNVTMSHNCQIECQEENQKITIGNDCMLSNHILIRNNDSHFIYDQYGNRINNAKNIVLGQHIWVAAGVTILKGVHIEDGSVIGTNSIVTHNIYSNCIAVGNPAKIVKENIYWTREEKHNV